MKRTLIAVLTAGLLARSQFGRFRAGDAGDEHIQRRAR